MFFTLPQQFGPYEVVRRLGGGGMGTVYFAYDPAGQPVAVKIAHFRYEDHPQAVERFRREAAVGRDIPHPNVCPVLDSGEINGVPYLVMPYLPGVPLSRHTQRPWPPRGAVSLVLRLADIIEAVHRQGLIHRDLKPANIMLASDGTLTVFDFGLARSYTDLEERISAPGEVLGTIAYMAPEQVRGDGQHQGPCTDVWALGVILYELLTGALPFGRGIPALHKIPNAEPERPSTRCGHLTEGEDRLCLRALVKESVGRYASMADFAAALRAFLGEGSAEPVSFPPDVAEGPATSELPTSPPGTDPEEPPADPARNALKDLGASIRCDEGRPGWPVVYLHLSLGNIEDALCHVAGLNDLRVLHLAGAEVNGTGLRHLAGTTGLRDLYLHCDRVADAGLPYLAQLPELRTLSLRGTRLTAADLASLASLSRLEWLFLDGTNLTDTTLTGLAGLRRLRWLDLSRTGVTDGGLPHLACLAELRALDLRATRTTPTGIEQFRSRLPDCCVYV